MKSIFNFLVHGTNRFIEKSISQKLKGIFLKRASALPTKTHTMVQRKSIKRASANYEEYS